MHRGIVSSHSVRRAVHHRRRDWKLASLLAIGAACTSIASCSETQPPAKELEELGTAQNGLIGPTFSYPLKVSANARYFVDQNNVPFLLNGFNPQSIVTGIEPSDYPVIFSAKANQGYNAANVWLVQAYSTKDSSTWDGIPPFTARLSTSCSYGNCWDLSAPNDAYFARFDAVVAAAASNNMVVFTTPIDGPVDFHDTLVANGTTRTNQYGRYLGNRYKNKPNIVWWVGGDLFAGYDDDANLKAIAQGIKSTDTVNPKLMTLQIAPSSGTSSFDGVWSFWSGLVNFSAVYNYKTTYFKQHAEYARTSPAIMPSVLMEALYEGDGDVAGHDTRKEGWWAALSGSTGSFYGAAVEWQAGPPFPSKGLVNNLSLPGAVAMKHLRMFFDGPSGFDWQNLVPDRGPNDPVNGSKILTQGMCTSGSTSTSCYASADLRGNYYATTARIPDGSVIASYIPSSRTVRIDMTKLCGASTAKWFNPADGTYTTIGTNFANTGTQDFTTPAWTPAHQSACAEPGPQATNCNDWVLFLKTNAACGGGPSSPTTTTAAASSISTTGALLNGNANPNGAATTGWFRYSSTNPGSCNDTFGTRTPTSGGTSLGSGNSAVGYSQTANGLTANTTYYFCAIAANSVGTRLGNVLSFTTTGGGGDTTPPTISNVSAGSVTSSGATITWTTDEASDTQIEYGLTTTYGSTTTLDGTLVTSHSQALIALSANTLYHYRVKSKDAAGNVGVGADRTLTTGASGTTITLGDNTVLSESDCCNDTILIGEQATLAQAATIQSLSFYVEDAAGKMRFGVYDATGPGGGPGAKKAETGEITAVHGWITANVVSPVSLPAGTYWLVYSHDNSGLTYRVTRSSGSYREAAFTYGPLPATFPTSTSSGTARWSFYATLAP